MGEGQLGWNPHRMVSLTLALSQRERELKSLNLMALTLRELHESVRSIVIYGLI
jgi:hypothetical protein